MSFPNSSAEGGSAQVEPKWPTNTSRSRQTIQLQICILETGRDPSVAESSYASEQCGVVGWSSEVTFKFKIRGDFRGQVLKTNSKCSFQVDLQATKPFLC